MTMPSLSLAREISGMRAASRSHLLKPDYPCPGLPLLLSPFAKLVVPHWTLLESLTIVFTVFLVYLMGLWSRK